MNTDYCPTCDREIILFDDGTVYKGCHHHWIKGLSHARLATLRLDVPGLISWRKGDRVRAEMDFDRRFSIYPVDSIGPTTVNVPRDYMNFDDKAFEKREILFARLFSIEQKIEKLNDEKTLIQNQLAVIHE